MTDVFNLINYLTAAPGEMTRQLAEEPEADANAVKAALLLLLEQIPDSPRELRLVNTDY